MPSGSTRAAVLLTGMFAAGTAMAAYQAPADPAAPPPPPQAAPADTQLDAHADRVLAARWVEATARADAERRAAEGAVMRLVERVEMWDRLAQCETGGNWRDGGDYGGGLGIYVGTWRMYGGREFAPRPQDATKAEQIAVAERIARDGMGGWGCAHRLGLA